MVLSIFNSPFKDDPDVKPPIGSIVAWVYKLDDTGEEAQLPAGWVKCNGATITDDKSRWYGKRVPDLNGERRFLRGGPDSSVLNLEDDQLQDHEHSFYDPGHTHRYYDKYPGDSAHGYMGPGVWGDKKHDRWDLSHSSTTGKKTTGIRVNGVTSARHGDETRVKNMNIIWIIRIF